MSTIAFAEQVARGSGGFASFEEANREQARWHTRLRTVASASTVQAADNVGFTLTIVGQLLHGDATLPDVRLKLALSQLAGREHELLNAIRRDLGKRGLPAYDPDYTQNGVGKARRAIEYEERRNSS